MPNYDENTDPVKAQVTGKPRKEASEVEVHEVSVTLDEPVLDPNSKDAVQTEGGEGSTDLPIHRLAAPSPEEALKSGDADEHEAGSGPVAGANEDADKA